MEQQNGSMLLKVMSIIMMIAGIVGAVASFIVAIVVGFLQTAVVVASADGQSVKGAGPVMGLLWAGVIILVAGAVIEIIAGVKGKKNWNNPAQAQTLMIWGIVAAVISLIGNILFSTGTQSVQFFTILSGLVVPVLYIVGTVQLKNQAQ